MKATGIIRRMDELGRVVVPKELRRTLKIREGDYIEIYTNSEQEMIMRKYMPLKELNDIAEYCCDSISESLGVQCLVCDIDSVAHSSNQRFTNADLSRDVSKLIYERKSIINNGNKINFFKNAEGVFSSFILVPIISDGDCIGALILYTTDKEELNDKQLLVAETMANYISKQMM